MSTIRDIIVTIIHAVQLAIIAFTLGIQLFYIIGPLVVGAFVGMFGFWVIIRYAVWPVAKFITTRTYRLGAWVVQGLLAQFPDIRTAERRQKVSSSSPFSHPVA